MQSCYSQVQECLVDDYVANEVCHDNLKGCLGDGHHAEEDYDEDSHGHHEENCQDKIKICLSSNYGDLTSCYDFLQNYLDGYSCSVDVEDEHHDDDSKHGYEEEGGDDEHWESIVSILLKKLWGAKKAEY